MKRLSDEEINKAAEGSFLPSHRARIAAEAQNQADREAIKASNAKQQKALEEQELAELIFNEANLLSDEVADQIIKLIADIGGRMTDWMLKGNYPPPEITGASNTR